MRENLVILPLTEQPRQFEVRREIDDLRIQAVGQQVLTVIDMTAQQPIFGDDGRVPVKPQSTGVDDLDHGHSFEELIAA